MAVRKKVTKKKSQPVFEQAPRRHRFPEDDNPSPYHDGRDPDAASVDDESDDENPRWTDYKETFYEVVVQHPMEQHRNAQQLRASDEKVLKDVALLRNTVSEVVRTTQARLEGKQREAVAILNALPDVRGALFPAPAEALEVDSHAVDLGAVGETSLPPTAAPLDTSHVPGSALAHTLLQPLAAPILNSWPLSTTHSTPPSQPIHQNAVASSSSISLPPLQQAAHTPVFRFTAQPPNACSEKVSLANDAYDKTDRHIRTLDTELDTHTLAGRYVPDFLQQAEELDENDDGSLLEVQAAPRDRKTRHRAHKGKGKAADDANDDFMHLKGVERVKAMMAGQSFSKDEPGYCFCGLPAVAEMVGCENRDCDREWFHLDCVGMKVAPKDKWWCPACEGDNNRPKKKRRT